MPGNEAVTQKPANSRSSVYTAAARRLNIGRSVVQSGTSYTTNLAWLVTRNVEGRRLKVLAGFALGQLSIAAQAAAFGALYWYAAQTQADAIVSLGPLGFELRAGEDLVLLGGVVAASAVCFLASSSFLYLSQNTLIGITEKSFPESLTECLRIARRLPDPRAPEASQIFLERGLTQVNRGCRYGASSTLALLNAVTPLIGGVAAGVVLLVIDPILTSMLAVAAALWSALLYPLMKRQVKFTDRLAKAKAEFSRESREALRSPFDLAGGTTSMSAAKLAKVMYGRRQIANRMRLVLQIGVALIVAVAALYVAYRIIEGDGDWPIFIVYIGGLRIALNGCFAAPRTFGEVSRFYPRLVVLIQFLQSAARIDGGPIAHVGIGDTVMLGTLADGTAVTVQGGDRLALAALVRAPLVQMAFLQARHMATGLPVATTWVQPAGIEPSASGVGIRLVEAEHLGAMDPPEASALLQRMSDAVTVIVHRDETLVGAFDEPHLVVVDEDGFTAHTSLGTAESRMVVKSFFDQAQTADAVARPDFDLPVEEDDEDES